MGSSAPHTISFAIVGPIARADLPGLCARVRRLLEDGAVECTAPASCGWSR